MILLTTLLACGNISFGDDPKGSSTSGCITAAAGSATSGNNSYAEFGIDVGGDDKALQIVTRRDSGAMTIDYLIDPDGNIVLSYEDWYSSAESLTYAFYLSETQSVFNYPIRPGDTPLSKGTWTVEVGTYDTSGHPQTGKEVTATGMTRNCQGSPAELNVAIAYAGGLDGDPVVTNAVEEAASLWTEIYGAIGIQVNFDYTTTSMNAALKGPTYGDADYETLYDSVDNDGIVMVIGDTIDNDNALYGMAGGIPGPMDATPISAVALSWLTHAGADGKFSDADTELMAETMAHESGHYLGLFHPVEMTYDAWDALDDTAQCSSMSQCDSKLGDNLMYPYPVCSGSGCVEQRGITDDQSTAAHNWIGIQ